VRNLRAETTSTGKKREFSRGQRGLALGKKESLKGGGHGWKSFRFRKGGPLDHRGGNRKCFFSNGGMFFNSCAWGRISFGFFEEATSGRLRQFRSGRVHLGERNILPHEEDPIENPHIFLRSFAEGPFFLKKKKKKKETKDDILTLSDGGILGALENYYKWGGESAECQTSASLG